MKASDKQLSGTPPRIVFRQTDGQTERQTEGQTDRHTPHISPNNNNNNIQRPSVRHEKITESPGKTSQLNAHREIINMLDPLARNNGVSETPVNHSMITNQSIDEQVEEEASASEIVEKLKQQLGNYVFQCQYQQNPINEKGFFIKANWILYYNESDYDLDDYFISIDCASTKDGNDYSIIMIIGVYNNLYKIIML